MRSSGRTDRWVIGALGGLALALGLWFGWILVQRARPAALSTTRELGVVFADENILRKAYPNVDFGPVYPDWSPEDIDQIQREIYGLRYIYEPFVQFRPAPIEKRFVTVTEAGYRIGAEAQPWPPDPDAYTVFVFGGSTTFSYGVPNDQTLVACLQKELRSRYPALRIQAYNFGAGHYFSSQERALFESLLLRGIVPDAAIFVDGINDYYFYDGKPILTSFLSNALTPDLPIPPRAPLRVKQLQPTTDGLLEHYRQNVRVIEAIARQFGVKAVFVGQPVPFVDLPKGPKTYPFPEPATDHVLCAWGYRAFEQAAASRAFGSHFIWCGDVFANAQSIMYADPLHYSAEGARVLAQAIVERASARGLLP